MVDALAAAVPASTLLVPGVIACMSVIGPRGAETALVPVIAAAAAPNLDMGDPPPMFDAFVEPFVNVLAPAAAPAPVIVFGEDDRLARFGDVAPARCDVSEAAEQADPVFDAGRRRRKARAAGTAARGTPPAEAAFASLTSGEDDSSCAGDRDTLGYGGLFASGSSDDVFSPCRVGISGTGPHPGKTRVAKPHVLIDRKDIQGVTGNSQMIVRRYLARTASQIADCAIGRPATSIRARFTISSTGGARDLKTTGTDEAAARCVDRAIRGITFPALPGAPLVGVTAIVKIDPWRPPP